MKSYEHHFRERNGPEEIESVGAMQLMGWTLLCKREYEEAKSVCATALGMTERLYGSHAVPTAAMMVNLATAYMNTGDLKLGPENLLKRAIIIFEDFKKSDKSLKEEDMNYKIGSAHLTLGNLYYLCGDENEAEGEYSKVEQMFNDGTFDCPEAASGLKNLAVIHWRRNDTQKAERLLSQALFSLEMSDKFGADHEQTTRVRDLLTSLRRGGQAPPSIILHIPFKDREAEIAASIQANELSSPSTD